jgi:hypothetical protein
MLPTGVQPPPMMIPQPIYGPSNGLDMHDPYQVDLKDEERGLASSSDEDRDNKHGGRSTAMMFDRSLVGDRNNLKTLILKAVYENQIHLQTRKGDAFDQLAQTLGLRDEFKPYKLHGRKLQKSFNKIARDIKDCIIQENEPSRWGKEEPEFFVIARKIFEEAKKAGIRAFDEKLKSKSIADRLGESSHDEEAKKKRKRDFYTVPGVNGNGVGPGGVPNNMVAMFTDINSNGMNNGMNTNPNATGGGANIKYVRFDDPDFIKYLDEFMDAKLLAFQQNHFRIHSRELEMSLLPILDRLVNVYNIHTIGSLLDHAQLSEIGKQKIFDATMFRYNDDVKLFLLFYCDVIMRGPQAVHHIQEACNHELSARDASLLYAFIEDTTKVNQQENR